MVRSLKFKHTFPAFGKLAQLLAHLLSFWHTFLGFSNFLNFWHTHSFSIFGAFSKTFTPFGLLSQLLAYYLNLWYIF